MIELILSGIAGIAIFLLILLLMYSRRQEIKIKDSIREIKKMQTGEKDYLNLLHWISKK